MKDRIWNNNFHSQVTKICSIFDFHICLKSDLAILDSTLFYINTKSDVQNELFYYIYMLDVSLGRDKKKTQEILLTLIYEKNTIAAVRRSNL